MVLLANVIRMLSTDPTSILGFYHFGPYGFLCFTAAATIPFLVDFYRQTIRLGLFKLVPELILIGIAAGTFVSSPVLARFLAVMPPPTWVHLGSHRN
jgi:hypothetical protein